MPYVLMSTSLKLTEEQKDKVKSEFGRLITILPTKAEAGLLVDFADGHTMYRAGEKAPCAFIEIRLFGHSEFEAKRKLTQSVFEMLGKELKLEVPRIYLNILEFDNWGTKGDYLIK